MPAIFYRSSSGKPGYMWGTTVFPRMDIPRFTITLAGVSLCTTCQDFGSLGSMSVSGNPNVTLTGVDATNASVVIPGLDWHYSPSSRTCGGTIITGNTWYAGMNIGCPAPTAFTLYANLAPYGYTGGGTYVLTGPINRCNRVGDSIVVPNTYVSSDCGFIGACAGYGGAATITLETC